MMIQPISFLFKVFLLIHHLGKRAGSMTDDRMPLGTAMQRCRHAAALAMERDSTGLSQAGTAGVRGPFTVLRNPLASLTILGVANLALMTAILPMPGLGGGGAVARVALPIQSTLR